MNLFFVSQLIQYSGISKKNIRFITFINNHLFLSFLILNEWQNYLKIGNVQRLKIAS